MSKRTYQSIEQVVNNDSDKLTNIINKYYHLQRLDSLVKKHLPKELAIHCGVMNQHGETLILGAENAAWATRLRFQAHHILANLQQAGCNEITNLVTRVNIPAVDVKSSIKSVHRVSNEAAEHLMEFAKSVAVNNVKLGGALKRLAEHLPKGNAVVRE